MAAEVLDLANEGVPFLLSVSNDEKLESSDISTSLEKVVKDVKDFIELRTDIFLQKEEKIQQYQQDQLRKLENEEQQYINKCKALEINLSECMKQLKEAENSFLEIEKKLDEEKELNKKLQDEMSNLTTEKDDLKERYRRTHSLYSTVIEWYENSLNVFVDIIKEDPLEIIFYFSKDKCSLAPYIKFEVVDDCKFKILDMHTDLKGNNKNVQHFYTTREIISLIYESHKTLERKS